MNIFVFIAVMVMLVIILIQDWNRIKLIELHVNAYTRLRESQEKERLQWKEERQQLLDRIQAPSYDHLKHHEVKVIKAQNPSKEEPKLEVM